MHAPRPEVPETVDPEEVSPAGPWRALKQFGLVLLCTTWVLLGLAGHDPWKTEDATSIGIAYEMAQRSDYVLPVLAGEPYLVRPPLIYSAAAVAVNVLSPPLEPHNAARAIVGVLLVLMLVFTSLASRELNGRAFRWLPVLILIGSVGFWDRAHALSPELGVTVGVALGCYGLALALRRPVVGGIALGFGIAVAYLSRGMLGPLWLVLAALLLPLAGSLWRTAAYGTTVACALGTALALSSLWPLALYLRDPALLEIWHQSEAIGTYLPFIAPDSETSPLFLLKNLLWFAWPALPLILWMLWTRGRGFNGGLAQPGVQIPGVLALVMLGSLMLMPNPSLAATIPLLVPLALLGALEVDSMQRDHSGALDWFGILTFGLVAIIAWGFWIDAYQHGMSREVARLFRDSELGYRPSFYLAAILAAVFMTVLWLMLVRPARRSNRRAVLNWAAGVTLVWTLYGTIWLPYLDSRRSYRVVVETAARQIPAQGCVASRNLGEPQRAVFYYFAGVRTTREELHADHQCDSLLVQYSRDQLDAPPPRGWKVVWEGTRRGDSTERYALYVRNKR